MNTTATLDNPFMDALRHWSAKFVARRIDASPRTVENWRDGRSIPTGRHIIAMLNDDELCARLLEAAGRGDLARTAERIAAEKALKAAISREGK